MYSRSCLVGSRFASVTSRGPVSILVMEPLSGFPDELNNENPSATLCAVRSKVLSGGLVGQFWIHDRHFVGKFLLIHVQIVPPADDNDVGALIEIHGCAVFLPWIITR